MYSLLCRPPPWSLLPLPFPRAGEYDNVARVNDVAVDLRLWHGLGHDDGLGDAVIVSFGNGLHDHHALAVDLLVVDGLGERNAERVGIAERLDEPYR